MNLIHILKKKEFIETTITANVLARKRERIAEGFDLFFLLNEYLCLEPQQTLLFSDSISLLSCPVIAGFGFFILLLVVLFVEFFLFDLRQSNLHPVPT